MGKALSVAMLAVMITGCVHDEAVLINDKGEKRYCYADHNTSLTRACRHLSQASEQTKCNPARKFRAVFS